ncbi:MAG: hypothetical protein HUU41_15865 [Bryobacteraceae bacterium]|nr:hypothetical protein [Bryobacterales bacterium]NUN02587.1 hypothetical protein [Bryobacteraceae bacterium]
MSYSHQAVLTSTAVSRAAGMSRARTWIPMADWLAGEAPLLCGKNEIDLAVAKMLGHYGRAAGLRTSQVRP